MEAGQDGIDLPALVDALSDPGAYAHAVRDLRVIQTHTSCVFLTGELVYKVKKPVDFGFLDYSTLDRRRHFCEEELALNRRLCPDVYLDVVPIVHRAGRIQVGGAGPVVEWAVRMRQLPEEDMLPARLAGATVTPAQIEQIAEVLACFHKRADAGPTVAEFGTPEAVSLNVEENFTQTEGAGDALPFEHLEVIREYARHFLVENRDLLISRMGDGRIRSCHGDLRAQNICLYPGLQQGIQIFDCIEFNDRLRYGDVAGDVAYLAMDLDLAGRADLRRVLIDRYKARSLDQGLSQVLPFYQCYRAYVRGKIALLAADEVEIPVGQRRAELDMASAAFDLARSYAAPRRSPALMITVGFSGSGKSVLSRELARRLPAVRIATDSVRKEPLGSIPTARLPEEQYKAEQRHQVYQEVYRRARHWLGQGEHVVLDGTFLSPTERDAAKDLSIAARAGFWVMECRCPDTLIRCRLRERAQQGIDASDADLAVYEAQVRAYGPPDQLQIPGSFKVEMDQPAGDSVRRVLRVFWKHEQRA